MSRTVQALHVYPVKALRGRAPAAVTVAPWGIETDRRWMVVTPEGRFLTQREQPAMARIDAETRPQGLRLSAEGHAPCAVAYPDPATAPRRRVTVWRDEVPALDAGTAAAAWLSAVLGLACGLVYLADPSGRPVDPAFGRPGEHVSFADGFPLLLTTTASLDALNAALPAPVPMARFRPNLVIATTTAWEEDRWRRIRVGGTVLRVVKPCARCLVTTVDQATGARPDKSEPLRTLGRLRRTADGVIFGQNLIPEGPGPIALGDPVEVLEAGDSTVLLIDAPAPSP